MNAQSCKFEAIKDQLQNHTLEVQREAMREIRKLEEIVCEMKAHNGISRDTDGQESHFLSKDSPLDTHGALVSRSSSCTSIGSDESPSMLRDRLKKEKRLRKSEERRHNLISEERTLTITELLATIKKLKLQNKEKRESSSTNIASVKRAIHTVSSEIINIRHSHSDI